MSATLTCVSMAGPASAEVSIVPDASGYDIEISGQASPGELLDAIASATGVSVKGQPEDATLTANKLHGVSMERALRKLLPGSAFAVRYGDDGRPTALIFLTSDTTDGSAPSDGDVSTQGMDDPTTTDGDARGDAPPDGSDGGDPNQPSQ